MFVFEARNSHVIHTAMIGSSRPITMLQKVTWKTFHVRYTLKMCDCRWMPNYGAKSSTDINHPKRLKWHQLRICLKLGDDLVKLSVPSMWFTSQQLKICEVLALTIAVNFHIWLWIVFSWLSRIIVVMKRNWCSILMKFILWSKFHSSKWSCKVLTTIELGMGSDHSFNYSDWSFEI